MIIRPMSDLHLEFEPYNLCQLPTDKQTVLVLAGDISLVHTGELYFSYIPFLQKCSNQFLSVVLVLGNHCHYHGNYDRTYLKLKAAIAEVGLPNVFLLENQSIIIEDVVFLGTTLWFNACHPLSEMHWMQMNDRMILVPGGRKMSVSFANQQFQKAVDFLKTSTKRYRAEGYKVVMITHHGVSYKSVADQFKQDPCTPFFVNDMFDLLWELNPELVVHGHTHSCFDYFLDDSQIQCQTRVVCNPKGYYTENNAFENTKLVTV